jgi:hypothetical protein
MSTNILGITDKRDYETVRNTLLHFKRSNVSEIRQQNKDTTGHAGTHALNGCTSTRVIF